MRFAGARASSSTLLVFRNRPSMPPSRAPSEPSPATRQRRPLATGDRGGHFSRYVRLRATSPRVKNIVADDPTRARSNPSRVEPHSPIKNPRRQTHPPRSSRIRRLEEGPIGRAPAARVGNGHEQPRRGRTPTDRRFEPADGPAARMGKTSSSAQARPAAPERGPPSSRSASHDPARNRTVFFQPRKPRLVFPLPVRSRPLSDPRTGARATSAGPGSPPSSSTMPSKKISSHRSVVFDGRTPAPPTGSTNNVTSYFVAGGARAGPGRRQRASRLGEKKLPSSRGLRSPEELAVAPAGRERVPSSPPGSGMFTLVGAGIVPPPRSPPCRRSRTQLVGKLRSRQQHSPTSPRSHLPSPRSHSFYLDRGLGGTAPNHPFLEGYGSRGRAEHTLRSTLFLRRVHPCRWSDRIRAGGPATALERGRRHPRVPSNATSPRQSEP